MKKKEVIIYWITTIIVGLFFLYSSYNLLVTDEMKAALAHLGYPDYFRIELGLAKGLGALTLLIPGLPIGLKRFAYAGFAIALVSAIVSHIAVGDPPTPIFMAAALLVVLAVSFAYLPARVHRPADPGIHRG